MQDRHADGAGVDPDDAHELDDLHDLLPRRAEPERVADVRAQAGLVEVRRRDVEGDVDHLLDLGLEHAVRPRDPGELRVGRQELGVEREDVVPERVPVAALGLEVRLDLAAAVVELAVDRLPGRLELLHEDRHADVAGVDAQGARQLEHLHELLARRPVADRVAHVLADAGLEQVRRGGVHREQHELLDLGLERPVAPRHRRELRYASKKSGSISSRPSHSGVQKPRASMNASRSSRRRSSVIGSPPRSRAPGPRRAGSGSSPRRRGRAPDASRARPARAACRSPRTSRPGRR